MMSPGFRLVIGIGFLLNALVVTRAAGAAVVDGVETGPVAEAAAPTTVGFDPPCSFMAALPLAGSLYLDPSTQIFVLDGEGAVVNECGGFNVTGYSKPNFLAWNCTARNQDGTKPELPLELRFSNNVSSVSINVGSNANAGSTATLVVYNAAHARIGAVSTVLAAEMKTLKLVRTGIRYMRLDGPCVMIADDLAVTH